MTVASTSSGLSWTARLLIGLLLLLAGAAAATWGLARNQQAARLLGVAPVEPGMNAGSAARDTAVPTVFAAPPSAQASADARIAQLEARLARVESAAQQVAGSAGRADALLVAFSARRAIERGVALGYLEPLLVNRFGTDHPRAVAVIVTASRAPVRLNDLIAEFDSLGRALRGPGRGETWWDGFKRELASVVEVRQAGRPSIKPDARYERARARLAAGEVDAALAETMRLPGAHRAAPWVEKARQYVAVRRALDEIESAALLGQERTGI